MSDKSIVYWYSSLEKHSCGYCKNERGNISHGMWAKYLTVEDYQNLIDRGWRRSGHYCYKPVMDQICCPMYTIKCDALNFQLSKSQKKVIKKFNKYLKEGNLNTNDGGDNAKEQVEASDGISDFVYREAPSQLFDKDFKEQVNSAVIDVKSDETANVAEKEGVQSTSQLESIPGKSQVNKQNVQPKSGVGADPNKPPCKKAKILRMERKQEKLLKRGMSLEKLPVKNEQKTLEEFLNDTSSDNKHKFKLELVNTSQRGEAWERLKKIEFALYEKYQMTVHNDPPGKCTMDGFMRFLVNSPLQHVRFSRDSDVGFGSFHQLYWLDDKLIAVGVIDILPKCVSAVYFFYDPDYRNLTLGTYGSLREVEFVRSLYQTVPSIKYYYMGFYIHSCQKMRYKGKLTPSFLLCPETYHWVPIEKCIRKLEVNKYSRLEENEKAVDENVCTPKDIDEIKILYNRRIVLFKKYKQKYGEEDFFNTIGTLVGLKCARSLIFFSDN